MATLNYTSTVSAAKTAGEIGQILAKSGAAAVQVRYTTGAPTGISFTLVGPHGERAFTLPVDVAAMHRSLLRQNRAGHVPARYTTPEQAERTAWRVVKDWLLAQLALVEAGMATIDQTMLPYLHVDGEVTLYDAYRAREQAALEAGSG